MADDFGLRIGLEGEKEFKKALTEINQSFKVLGSEMKLVSSQFDKNENSVEAFTARNQVLNREVEEQKKKIETLRAALDNASASFGENDKRTKNWQIQLNNAQAALNDMERELKQNERSLNNLKNGLYQTEEQFSHTEKSAKDFVGTLNEMNDTADKSSGILSKLGDTLNIGSLSLSTGMTAVAGGAAALGAAAAAVGKYAVDFAGDVEQSSNSFVTSTGIAKNEAKAFEDAMLDIYNDNFGEDLNDISLSMAEVAKQTKEVDPSKVAELTEYALMLRDTFGYDVNEQIRTANMLMTQFGISGEEAFTLIAQGAQKGLDKNGDMLDTINEYAVQFKSLGFDAEDMFNILISGAESGAFSVDKAGDAVKEFGIRVKDGSESTAGAFEDLGLNVEEISSDFAAGGDKAQQAFEKVTNALFAMKDPLKQNQTGVALFGTMWEDLGKDGVKALTSLNKQVNKTADTLDDINDIKYDDLESAFKGAGRAIQTGFVLPIGKKATPAFKEFAETISKGAKEANGDIGEMADVFSESVGNLIDDVSDVIPEMVSGGGKIVSGVIKGVVGATPKLAEAATEMLFTAVKEIPNVAAEALIAAPQIPLAVAGGIIEGIVDVADASSQLFSPIKSESIDAEKSLRESAAGVTAFTDAIKNAIPNTADYTSLLSDYGRSISEIDMLITETENSVTSILAAALQNQQELRQEDLDSIREYTNELYDLQLEKIQIYRDQQIAELRKLQLDRNNLQQEDAAQYLANTQAALDAANTATEEAYTQQLTIIENKYRAAGELGSEAYSEELRQAKEFYDNQLAENQSYYDNAVSIVSSATENWIADDKYKWLQLSQQMDFYEQDTKEGFEGLIQATDGWLGGFSAAKDDFALKLSEMDLDTANAFLSMVANVKASGGDLTVTSQDTVNSMLNTFDNLPPELDSTGKEALLSMISGLETYIPELEDTADLTANDIVDILRNEWGLDSENPVFTSTGKSAMEDLKDGLESKEDDLNSTASKLSLGMSERMDNSNSFYTAGDNSSQGYINGFKSNESQLFNIAAGMASGALGSMKRTLGINSPSKEFAKLGKFSAEGYAEGFEKETEHTQKILKSTTSEILKEFSMNMKTSQLTGFDINRNIRSAYDGLSAENSPGFTVVLNIANFNNYSSDDIRQLTNEVMETANQFAMRKGAVFA